MNLDNEIIAVDRKVAEIMESGYSKAEALILIQTAAMAKLSNCVTHYNYKDYFKIMGNMATYEQ